MVLEWGYDFIGHHKLGDKNENIGNTNMMVGVAQ